MDAQSLRSIIKSARDLMRKDAGPNTDVDRIPQLAWILFLKSFDDFEKKRSALNKKYMEAIPKGSAMERLGCRRKQIFNRSRSNFVCQQ